MKKWYSSLDICYKTAFISAIVLLVAVAGTTCLFFLGWREIPLGIILGCSVSIISYLLMGIVNVKAKPNKVTGTIIITIIRFILIAAVIFMSAWFYYKLNLRLFNVFAVAGSYFIPTICLCIIWGKEGKNNV